MTATPHDHGEPRVRIAATIGDPSGIGAEVLAKLLSRPDVLARADVTVLAHEDELSAAAEEAGVSLSLATRPSADAAGLHAGYDPGPGVERGVVSEQAGKRALQDLRRALGMYQDGEVDGILFAPLNKSALALAGMDQEDELRWFATQLGFNGPTSELNFVPGLATARVTSHIPVKEITANIDAEAVAQACALLQSALSAQGIDAPRLAVCALNPHAGENGKFGTEEIDHIAPGVELARSRSIDASGPFPCDTVFIRAFAGDYDGVVTMYHDQGQIALKLHGFDEGVTVLGGLEVPIATPAHGTAHGIVGQGRASSKPIERAFETCVNLAVSKARSRAGGNRDNEGGSPSHGAGTR